MSLINLGRKSFARYCAVAAAAVAVACAVAACSSTPPSLTAAEQPLSKETATLLAKKGMDAQAPIFIRIFKEDSELEVWKARDDGRFYHFKTYPICNWSGGLGPKIQQGDRQAPEGFYSVGRSQLNPNSLYHVAFNLGYPNAYDRSLGRTGDFIMIHGKCKSAGCYAMTDALIEEIYALTREAMSGGQETVPVHIFPFKMTDAKLVQFKKSPWYPFWQTLKQGYDHFEQTRVPPNVAVCEHKYIVNVANPSSPYTADGRCPHFERPAVPAFIPDAKPQQVADDHVTIPGQKLRSLASIAAETEAAAAPVSALAPATAQAAAQSPGAPKGAFALGFSR